MRMHSATGSEARVLSDAEIAMVAGGGHLDDIAGNVTWLDESHTFARANNGMILADYTHDGSFEEGWRPNQNSASGWDHSFTGYIWDHSSTTPDSERTEYYSTHQYWFNVGGGNP
jgi:hypothetical protein